jgi:UDP-2-acetamido-2,6-beta-L-arabino-hexul-4-ose reductase
MRVVLTGAAGFLGWHTRARLRALTEHEVVPVARGDWSRLPDLVRGADAVIHIAGVNRGAAPEVEGSNVRLAQDLADAVAQAGGPIRLVFANSIQSGNATAYGSGKQRAAEVLRAAAGDTGGSLVDVRLPNLFGEHGRPAYNSFVATFVDAVVRGESPTVEDREVTLLHAQDAAQVLIDALHTSEARLDPAGTITTVVGVLDLLREFHETYAKGDVPALDSKLRVDLFNTYRAALFPERYPIVLPAHADHRGRLVETVRAHGGQGQTFVSTTRPGVTRGEHFHLGKVERFVVLSGQARISLRRVFHDDVVSFDVSGEQPAVVDMPTMWVHNITNIGDSEVTTLFWTHSLFDPEHPDTFWEPVSDPAREVTA